MCYSECSEEYLVCEQFSFSILIFFVSPFGSVGEYSRALPVGLLLASTRSTDVLEQ